MPLEFTPCVADPKLKELGIHRDTYSCDLVEISKDLIEAHRVNDEDRYLKIVRTVARQDLFFLLYFVLDYNVNHPFIVARCYEAQFDHNMTVDLWARAHYKSTILTYALPIWQLLQNPEERIAIFSHTRTLAKAHMRKIKTTLENNSVLIHAFPDIFYENPQQKAPTWSEDVGLFVKRHRSYAEASIEANGLIDHLPTGKHYTVMVYDDTIDLKNVSSYHQVTKATEYFRMSLALSARKHTKRIIGTRYSHKDTYAEIMKNHRWKVRVFPAEVDNAGNQKREGIPVLLSKEELEDYSGIMGSYVYSSQMLQYPVAEEDQKFRDNWIRFYKDKRPALNYYIVVDPATTKKKSSDYTVMAVVGTDYLRNYWLVDMIRDRLDLGERWNKLKGLVLSWGITEVGYEQYGAQADVEFMQRQMAEEGVFFNIIELGGNVNKEDRIKKLIPDFQKGRWLLPESLVYRDISGAQRELISEFIEEEYLLFPFSKNDDMLDCLARIYEAKMHVIFPSKPEEKPGKTDLYDPLNMKKNHNRVTSWMAVG